MAQNMVRRIVEPDPGHTGARKKEIMNMANTISSNSARPLLAWRVIDIIIAAVFAVAVGLIFWVWNSVGYAWYTAANAVTPGLGGIATGMWRGRRRWPGHPQARRRHFRRGGGRLRFRRHRQPVGH